MDLDPELIPGMGLGALGLHLLRDASERADARAAERARADAAGHPYVDVTSEAGRYGQDPAAREAVIEAWAWLHAQGLTVVTSDSGARLLVSVTRRGRRALVEGLGWVRQHPFHEA